jgi:hypothetical protein
MSPSLNRSFAIAKITALVTAGVLAFSAAASAQHPGGGGLGHGGGSYLSHRSYAAQTYGHYGYGDYRYGHYGYYPRPYGYGLGLGLGFGHPYYYGGWYSPYYGHGYGGYGYGGLGYGYYEPRGSLRIEVKPDQARVYVDGSYVGIVDDFDGAFQRLHLSPGRHEIALKQEGFKTHRVMVYAPSGHTVKLRYEMIRGTGEDARDDLAAAAAVSETARDLGERNGSDLGGVRGRDGGLSTVEQPTGPGELSLSLRPEDASVYVDGRFCGAGREAERLLLPPGRHRVEVTRPGFRTLDREVDVRAGRTVELDASMEQEQR